jgi:hypothetical protein
MNSLLIGCLVCYLFYQFNATIKILFYFYEAICKNYIDLLLYVFLKSVLFGIDFKIYRFSYYKFGILKNGKTYISEVVLNVLKCLSSVWRK